MTTTYRDWSPTRSDTRGLNLPDRQNWLVVPCLQTRDSDVLERSNHRTALKRLGGEGDQAEVHRFSHWACGWLEIILAHPDLEPTVTDIHAALEDYPVLDEMDMSELEAEED